MDVSVALLQLRSSAEKSLLDGDYNPLNFELLVCDRAASTSSSSAETPLVIENSSPLTGRNGNVLVNNVNNKSPTDKGSRMKVLPRCRMQSYDDEPSEVALGLARRMSRRGGGGGGGGGARAARLRRAVRVALWSSEASSVSSGSDVAAAAPRNFGALFCIPLLEKDKHVFGGNVATYSLAKLVNQCNEASADIDAESRHLILRLDQWLREKQNARNRFLAHLFLRSATATRLRVCAHNPAHPDEKRHCSRATISSRTPTSDDHPCDLADDTRRANGARAQLMALEKCDIFIMNQLFGARLPYRGQTSAVSYYAKHRPSVSSSSGALLAEQSPLSSAGDCLSINSWQEDFPLHRCAYAGEATQLRALLQQGHDPNLADGDSWTPLHYAAWYNRLGALEALVSYGSCDVNARSRTGSTPLHFAAAEGHAAFLELLLTSPAVDLEARNLDGRTALDVCECNPRADWQAAAALLRATRAQRLPKMQVDLLDGSNVLVPLVDGADTSAARLQQLVAAELRVPDECAPLFALWICSDSLELQLKAEHKPSQHMARWQSKTLPRWSDSTSPETEEPHLVFRRNARATLADEKKTKLSDSTLALLYDEARLNYVRARYLCPDKDIGVLAALLMQILHGDFDAKKDKQLLADERTLRLILPHHKQKPGKALSSLVSSIASEHKRISSKGSKSVYSLQCQFLSFCWNLRVYGSTFFDAMVFMSKPQKGAMPVNVGVNDYGLHLINSETKSLAQTYALDTLEWTFDDSKPFMEVTVRITPLHLFTLRTRQANHINTLLKWLKDSKTSK